MPSSIETNIRVADDLQLISSGILHTVMEEAAYLTVQDGSEKVDFVLLVTEQTMPMQINYELNHDRKLKIIYRHIGKPFKFGLPRNRLGTFNGRQLWGTFSFEPIYTGVVEITYSFFLQDRDRGQA